MTDDERVERFVEAVKDDPRVRGVARMSGRGAHGPALLVVTTWDGFESMPRELPRLGALLLPDGPIVDFLKDAHWAGLAADGARAGVTLLRVGDLKPRDPDEPPDTVVWDPHGFLANWIACPTRQSTPRPHAWYVVEADRMAALLSHSVTETSVGRIRRVKALVDQLRADDPVDGPVRARLEAALSQLTRPGGGERICGPQRLDEFLRVADDEGFKGDRVLFGEAVARLRALSKREPVFDQGFVVPTFDAVEAAFALGEAVGGCQPPLIPGVWVGVGVTPTDALEFWAAPFVRDPTCSVACVDDTGERDVVERAAGREPMVATLTSAIDAAWERLPALIDRARDAAKEQVDPSAVLAPLHLPKSFVERAKRRGAGALMCSRLTVALAVARAGHDCAPLVARKFGLAAGRVLAAR